MPFTPYHFGVGLAAKAASPRWFSFVLFVALQVVIDLESLYNLTYQRTPVHRELHTFVGGSLLAVAATGLIVCLGRLRIARPVRLPTVTILATSLFATWSHVVLDAIMHGDARPLWPWSDANPLLSLVDRETLHRGCVVLAALGLAVLAFQWSRREHHRESWEAIAMAATGTTERGEDPFHLARFLRAQADDYDRALAEIRQGRKRSHWMWYIFPQLDGLAVSATSKLYAIRSLDEARAYLDHPVLGRRLVECAEAALGVEGKSATAVFGTPDDLKLRSCATLFACVAPPGSVFHCLLAKYYPDGPDTRTLDLLGLGPETLARERPRPGDPT